MFNASAWEWHSRDAQNYQYRNVFSCGCIHDNGAA